MSRKKTPDLPTMRVEQCITRIKQAIETGMLEAHFNVRSADSVELARHTKALNEDVDKELKLLVTLIAVQTLKEVRTALVTATDEVAAEYESNLL